MAVKLTRNMIYVNGRRAGIDICAGPWVSGVPADLIKIRFKKWRVPVEIKEAVNITNNSDSRTDYFEKDTIRLMPGDPLYAEARSLCK